MWVMKGRYPLGCGAGAEYEGVRTRSGTGSRGFGTSLGPPVFRRCSAAKSSTAGRSSTRPPTSSSGNARYGFLFGSLRATSAARALRRVRGARVHRHASPEGLYLVAAVRSRRSASTRIPSSRSRRRRSMCSTSRSRAMEAPLMDALDDGISRAPVRYRRSRRTRGPTPAGNPRGRREDGRPPARARLPRMSA